jgi:hypothetical protein
MTAPLHSGINIDRSYIRHLSEVRAFSQQQPLDGLISTGRAGPGSRDANYMCPLKRRTQTKPLTKTGHVRKDDGKVTCEICTILAKCAASSQTLSAVAISRGSLTGSRISTQSNGQPLTRYCCTYVDEL